MSIAAPESPSPLSFADINAAIQAAPDLGAQPGMVMGLAQAGFPSSQMPDAAEGLAGAAQQTAAVNAVHHQGSIFGDVLGALNHVRTGVWDHIPGHDAVDTAVSTAVSPVGDLLNLVNKSTGAVAHEYRYTHDVFQRHGAFAGLTTLLSLVGSTGGTFLAQELGSGLYQDSWDRTENGSAYRDASGQSVNPGHDVANLLHIPRTASFEIPDDVRKALGWTPLLAPLGVASRALGAPPLLSTDMAPQSVNVYDAVSGAVDGAFTVTTDPTLVGGKAFSAIRTARTVITSAADFERMARAATDLHNGATVAAGLGGPTTKMSGTYRMMNDVAKSDTATIFEHYPSLAALAPQLGKVNTVPEVVDTLRTALKTSDMLGTRGIPTFSFTRIPFRALGDKMRNYDVPDGTGVLTSLQATPARAIRAFGNRIPFAYDPGSMALSPTTVDPLNPRAAAYLYKQVRFSQNASVARAVANAFAAAPTVAEKTSIWRQAQLDTIASRGLNDPAMLERLRGDMVARDWQAGGDKSSQYGFGADGNDLSHIPDPGDGGTTSAAIWEGQAGQLHMLDLAKLNTASRELRAYTRIYGRVDDGIYKYYTAALFKPQALLTGGFAVRNSGNEMLTRVMGADGIGVLRSLIASTAAKMNYKLLPNEADSVTAAMATIPGFTKRLADPDYLEAATRSLLEHDGHMLPPGAQAGHTAQGYGGDVSDTMLENVKRALLAPRGQRLDPSGRFTTFTSSDGEQFGHALAGALKMVTTDEGGRLMSQAYRDALASGATLDDAATAARTAGEDYLRSDGASRLRVLMQRSQISGDPNVDPLTHWAAVRMHNIQGLTTDGSGRPIQPIIDGLADAPASGDLPEALHPDKLNALGADSLPKQVQGVPFVAVPNNLLQRVQNAGFVPLSHMMNAMSREPIYLKHLSEEWKLTKSTPGLTEDEAWVLAQSRATERMIPEIHNPLDRSQFAIAARNLMPFYFAREQAYRRMAQSIVENPVGFRRIQVLGHAFQNIGFIHTDPSDGQQYFNYPLSGEVGRAVPAVLKRLGLDTTTGIPMGFRGDVSGLYAGGESPDKPAAFGWGPMVTVPTKALTSIFPELSPVAQRVLGPQAASAPVWAAAFPNAPVRNAIMAYAGDNSRQFQASMMDAIQAAVMRGDLPPQDALPGDPGFNEWLGRIKMHTRIGAGLRALFSIGAPASPQLEIGDWGLRDEFREYLTKYGLSDGTHRFLTKHPDATPYTVFQSEAPGGAAVPYTQQAENWALKNLDFIHAYGRAATFFTPQTLGRDPNARAIYNDQIALGLREKKTPEKFTSEILAQNGWNAYEADSVAHKQAIANAGQDQTAIAAENANWQKYLQTTLAPAYPVWWQDFNNSAARNTQRQQTVATLQKIIDSKKAPESPMTPLISELLSDYAAHTAALAAIKDPNSTTYGQVSRQDETDNWQQYLATYVQQHPEATSIVNSLFKHL